MINRLKNFINFVNDHFDCANKSALFSIIPHLFNMNDSVAWLYRYCHYHSSND